MRCNRPLVLVAAIVLLSTALVMGHEKDEKLGQVHFPVSCSKDAQVQFDRAVALLHSFWYAEAAKGFTTIPEADPTYAMGYWGIAMSVWYPLWQPPSEAMLKKGRGAVEQAKAVGAKTEREQQYIAAIEVFYKDADTLDHRTRSLAYEKAMEQLYQRYQEDREAAVFYALALNATASPNDKTYANQLKATAILAKDDEAVTLMRSAADLEDSTEKHPVTPAPIFPAREMLGDLLLELNHPTQALQEFETSMQREPNRFNGFYGAARAAELSGDRDKARKHYASLIALCEQADSDRPELLQAKVFLAQR